MPDDISKLSSELEKLDANATQPLIRGLRTIIALADELIRYDSIDMICRRTVELAREQLDLERCAVFMLENDVFQGTYGTGLDGQTTDEHQQQFPRNMVWDERLRALKPNEPHWIVVEETRYEWSNDAAQSLMAGWVAITPIFSAGSLIGIVVNDTAMTNRPLNPFVQEVLVLGCTLLGNIIHSKRVEMALQQANEQLESHILERTAELREMNDALQTEIQERTHAQEELAAERTLLRTLIDIMPDYIFVKDAAGRFLLSNIAHSYAVRVENPEDFIGKSAYDFFPHELAAQYEIDDNSVLQTGQPLIDVERVTRNMYGRKIWVSTTKVPIFDRQGKIAGLVGISRDISDRKKAEETLANERTLLRTVIDAVPQLIWVKDLEGRFVLANRYCLADRQFTSFDSMIGKTDFDLHPLEQAQQYDGDDKNVMRTGQPIVDLEEQNLTPNGVMRWLLTSKLPLHDAQGSITGMVGIAHDITDRKRAEEALRQARAELEQRVEERTAELSQVNKMLKLEVAQRQQAQEKLLEERNLLRTLIDNLPHYIYVKDTQARFVITNPAMVRILRAQSSEELMSQTDFDIYPPELAEKYYADDMSVIKQGRAIINQEEPAVDEHGNRIWVLTTKLPLRNAQDEITGLVGIGLDISERKQAEWALQQARDELERRVEERTAELQVANDEIRRFAYIVSHDLRAPLVNIRGFSSELEYALQTIRSLNEPCMQGLNEAGRERYMQALQEDVPEALRYINASVERMDYFVNAVLRLSRIGTLELHPEPIDPRELVETILKSLAHQIGERQAEVTVDAPPVVVADRIALEQIFGNILTNAVLYLDPARPGRIALTGEAAERETIFHIRDNGRGIATEDYEKVFEPFRRAGMPTTPGEGLGLAYVQALVRRHGGRIWFESALGTGTTFSFTIPNHTIQQDE